MTMVHFFQFQLSVGGQESFMRVGCSQVGLLGGVGWLLWCTERLGRSGIHSTWHRCECPGVFSTAKLTFLHSFPVEVVIALGGLYQFSKVVGFAKYGDLIFEVVGKSIIELKMKGPISPVNACGECVEMNQILHRVRIMIHE